MTVQTTPIRLQALIEVNLFVSRHVLQARSHYSRIADLSLLVSTLSNSQVTLQLESRHMFQG